MYNGRLFVFGGFNSILNDSFSDSWSSGDGGVSWILEGALPTPRERFATVVFNQTLWILGGFLSTNNTILFDQLYYAGVVFFLRIIGSSV